MEMDYDLEISTQARSVGMKRKNDNDSEVALNPSKLLKTDNHDKVQPQCGHNIHSLNTGLSQISTALLSLRDENALFKAHGTEQSKIHDDQKREIDEIKKLVIHSTDVFIELFKLVGNVSLQLDKLQSIDNHVRQEQDYRDHTIDYLIEQFNQVCIDCGAKECSG